MNKLIGNDKEQNLLLCMQIKVGLAYEKGAEHWRLHKESPHEKSDKEVTIICRIDGYGKFKQTPQQGQEGKMQIEG